MGPREKSRGKQAHHQQELHRLLASMGPREKSRGKV